MKILYLTTVLPRKRKTGGEIASQCFIDALAQSGHNVVVVGYQRKNDAIEKICSEISVDERYIETNKNKLYPTIAWMMLGLIKNLPYSSAKYYSENYLRKIQALLASDNYDVVIVDHAQLGWLANLINNQAKLIFIAHNVEHELYAAQAVNTNNHLAKSIYIRESHLIKDLENQLANKAQEVWTFTSHDFSYFSSVKSKTRVFDLPSSLMTLPVRLPVVKKCDVGIIGTWTWKANSLGLEWFFQAVYPHLPADLSIQVAGKGAEWLQGRYSNVKYCGFVPSAQEFMEQAKVIAIPSISGSGVQIKTLDAIASGSPVVATPIAMRGISGYPSCVSVAERPEDFANNLIKLVPIAQNICWDGIAWSQSRREKFFAAVDKAIDAHQTEKSKDSDLAVA